MKQRIFMGGVLLLVLLAIAVAPVIAAPKDDVVSLVNKAIEYINTNGREKAYDEFTENKTGAFKKGELYIFVLTRDYMIIAHGANKKLIGKDLKALKDSRGKYFFKEMVDNGLKDGQAWVDYYWTNPKTNKPGLKSSYVKKLDGETVVGCGYYLN